MYAEKVCTWQTSGTDNTLTIGSWDYICDEDMCYVELVLPTTGVIQLYGDSSSFGIQHTLPDRRLPMKVRQGLVRWTLI